MKMRFKPALRSRLLATGVSVAAFVTMVSGFIIESQAHSPDQSVKLSGENLPLAPEVLFTQNPIPSVDTAATQSPTTGSSPTSIPSAGVDAAPGAGTEPSAKPAESVAPVVNPSPSFTSGVQPANPSIPVPPDVDQGSPEEPVLVYTCMSPGGNMREPMGTPSCPTKWGYVLTLV